MFDEKEIYNEALKKWGEREQSAVAMEECGELIRAINKMHRCPSGENRLELISEIADVLIMIDQLMFIYDIKTEKINETRAFKISRLAERLEVINEK